MARKPRENVEFGIYHVTARGNNRGSIFVDDEDRHTYLWYLGAASRECSIQLLGYCLMGNHVHLLIETPEANLSEGMKRVQGAYAQRFNRKHERSGHVFQGRYGAERVAADSHLLSLIEYIALNPVRAGLCREPQDWPWSSFGKPPGALPSWLMSERLFELVGGSKAA